MFLIDSHCHLDILNKIDYIYNMDYILFKSNLKNIKFFLNVSINLTDSLKAWKIFNKYKNIFYSCGVHPLNVVKKKYSINDLIFNSSKDYVVAIGETGLDYLKEKNNNNRIKQQKSFLKHLIVSNFLKKPIIIHSRNSFKEIINIVKYYKLETYGIWHCFDGDISMIRKILDNNFYISLSGLITFSKSSYLRRIIKFIPLNKILIETDSPYLAPNKYRGKINYPFYIHEVINLISKIYLINIKKLSYIIKKNFFNIIRNKIYLNE